MSSKSINKKEVVFLIDKTVYMKKYLSIGELLIDYRKENQISQMDFSSSINVDIRTVQRWEKDTTLIKPEKEKEIVSETLLPYQLIRNLNANVPIPTYYDFRIRKYSLTELNNDLPDARWLKERMNDHTKRVRTIDPEKDLEILKKDLKIQKLGQEYLSLALLKQAVELLPELNLIIMDDFDNYSGHCIVFPIDETLFEKLKQNKISDDKIKPTDLISPKTKSNPIFYNYDITADCNDNVFYMAHNYLKFFVELENQNYTFCSCTMRYDTYKLNEQLGLELVWQDEVEKDYLGLAYHPRFYIGNFKKYLSEH